jgi:succinate-semialdehyde dehydrogenase/glutarate-semialdehyde dehydrogenase
VTNPATGDTLAEVPDMGVADTVAAVDAANAAFPQWAATPAKQRSQLLTKWHDAVVAEKTYLAELM